MANPNALFSRLLILFLCMISNHSFYGSALIPPPPANDNCANATPIVVSGGGFDYGVYNSASSDLSMATSQAGEFFAESGHTKSVWYEFTMPTSRSMRINMGGSNLDNVAVTVYEPTSCPPQAGFLTGTLLANGGGDIFNSCSKVGVYRVQVTGPANSIASVFIILTLSCPSASTALYDCPADAYVFNGGNPLTSAQVSTGNHDIECQSLEQSTEYDCLTIPNKTNYLKSTWYVFTTGSTVDLLIFYFGIGSNTDRAGYRLFEGDVRSTAPDLLPMIECGAAIHDDHTRHIEFPCILKPNTTYTLSLIFHKDFDRVINLSAQQRGTSATGWPIPVQPPVIASNALGTLPESVPGTTTVWMDRFDCSSYIIDNVCPPANPASGNVVIGVGNNARTFDLSTWATFTISEDAHVELKLTSGIFWGEFHTRIFSRTINAACPSPNTGGDLFYSFSGREAEIRCMPPGDYSIQVLTSSGDPNTLNGDFDEAWTYGCLGTNFTMDFKVYALPSVGLFKLDSPDSVNLINNLIPLQENILYPSIPAVLTCRNTVIPAAASCPNMEKAIYRQVTIADANGDGLDDSGLLSIKRLRTDTINGVQLVYSFLQGNANQLATAAGTHDEGELIPGLTDYPGFCIDQDDNTFTRKGIDSLCVCVTPETYTLASLGNGDHVGLGDDPGFIFNIYNTVHDSRPNAELINVGGVPGTYASDVDIFSCEDNLGTMPQCGRRKKLIYREFFLADSALVTISDVGSSTAVISLFSGQATDVAANLELIAGCAPIHIQIYDPCNPLPEGWYTVVSYGEGPNYTDNRVWNTNVNLLNEYQGDPRDVGRTSRIVITLEPPIIPNYNRPDKAYHAGTTDWNNPPVGNPNATTSRVYQFPRDTFCLPDTPFIPIELLPCSIGYNRVSMYVFEITKPSFVQIRNIDQTYYTEVFPFDVTAEPGSLLTVPPVYQCVSTFVNYRQICDLPPGIYTIAIFATDDHEGESIGPSIYVDKADQSRFDHVWNAYDFDQIPRTNTFVNGKAGDIPPIPGQAPSRDVFYCTTGATTDDPQETRCATQLNPLIYAQPAGVPKPLFLQNQPPQPLAQPWRNLWYTFELSGSGLCRIESQVLGGSGFPPFMAVYESDADGSIAWSDLQNTLMTPGNPIISGLTLITENVNTMFCDPEAGSLNFIKSGCLRDSVRYYVMVSFDADDVPNMPNQTISLSIRYDGRPTFIATYDERPGANVLNGLVETMPPYTNQPLSLGNEFVSTDFSLLCYTRNVTDPLPSMACPESRKSAWFKFEVSDEGQFYAALERRGGTPGWHTDPANVSVWREDNPGSPLTEQLFLTAQFVPSDNHSWLRGCIEPGIYYLLVRHCETSIDTIEPYRVVIKLTDSPGDFCSNAIPLNVPDFTPTTATVIPDCHTIGTDYGEFSILTLGCLYEPIQQKTSWFKVSVTAGPETDITFQLTENLSNAVMDQLSYRVFVGSCGALTPIACSSIGSNIITQRCLAPGDYFIQVAMPQNNGNDAVVGSIDLTITATPNTDPDCVPRDVLKPLADFIYTSDCETISFTNFSSAGTDITYLWEFPDGTSTDPNPTWTPPDAIGTYPVTLIVTNIVHNTKDTVTIDVSVNSAFLNYIPLQDLTICNDEGPITVDATIPGPGTITYQWDNNSPNPVRAINADGLYWIKITKDGCELIDTFIVNAVQAKRNIISTLCPGEGILVSGQWFDQSNPSGDVHIPNADPSGCDSIVTVDLSFYAPSGSQLSETICHGDIYTFGTQQLSVSGIYGDTLTSARGCDSIVVLTLTVKPQETHDHVVSGCQGETLTLSPVVPGVNFSWNVGSPNDTLSVADPGTYVVSVSDAAGCIVSIETFSVSFGILASPDFTVPEPICPAEDVLLIASGSLYDYRWFDAVTAGNLLGTGPTLLLTNVQRDTFVFVEAYHTTIDGCVSNRERVDIEVIEVVIQTETLDTLICFGNAVELPWGEVVVPEMNSSYTHSLPSVLTGCDSLRLTVSVEIEDIPFVSFPSVYTLFLGDSVQLIPQLDFQPDSLAWTPEEGLSCINCLQPWASPVRNSDYQITLWTEEGCVTSAIARIEVNNEVIIYFPNVFSPNGDGINDKFTVSSRKNQLLVRTLTIYDRWGGALWQGLDFIADGTGGWDGLSRGERVPAGVFVWMCEVEMLDGSREVFSGDVTLLR